ncbi:hypothetical protein D3C71_1490720 [compost metagenome]
MNGAVSELERLLEALNQRFGIEHRLLRGCRILQEDHKFIAAEPVMPRRSEIQLP